MRAGHVPPRRVALQRVAGLIEGDRLGELHRQVGHRHRDRAAGLAVDDRDRAAPVALARDAPVPQAELHLAGGDPLPFEPPGHRLEGLVRAHPVEEARIDHPPVLDIGGVGDHEAGRILSLGADHGRVAEPVLVREIEVALVVRRAAEHRAGAVLHQHEVRHVDRQLPGRVQGMADGQAGVEAVLLGRVDRGLGGAGAAALLDEGLQLGPVGGQGGRQRVVGRDRQELGAEQRVGPGRVDGHRLGGPGHRPGQGEPDLQPLGAADPVLLHQPDLLGPAVQPVEGGQQVLGEIRDLEEPLGQLALLHQGAGAPAAPVDHLLVGQHRVVHRVPVHLGGAAGDEALVQEIQEHALLVLVVVGIAGRDLPAPVERQAHGLQLVAHRCDVGVGPVPRVDLALHGGVLGGQPEGVPAHRVQHVEAAGALVAGDHVAHRVVADVAHVDPPRRVGEHLQHVVFRARVAVVGLEQALRGPGLLPARLGILGVVALDGLGGGAGHGSGWVRGSAAATGAGAARFAPR